MLTTTVMATKAKVLIAPAMNTNMYENPILQRNINTLKELGYKVPEDIAIVGFDDIVLSSLIEPKLTTVRVEKDLMGKKAIDRLLWRLENKKSPDEKTILSVEIVERESVGRK